MANITIIVFGARGDAQPAIALGKGLQATGHLPPSPSTVLRAILSGRRLKIGRIFAGPANERF